MEGLGLVDYGSEADDDERSPGASEQALPLSSLCAAQAVHELEHLDSAAALNAAAVKPTILEVAGTPQEDMAPALASTSELANGHTKRANTCLDLQLVTPGVVATSLQDAVNKYLKMRRDLGVEVKAVIGLSRDFRNPYFLQKWVQDANIDQGGSCMPTECFDPASLHEEDFYCKLEEAWRKRKAGTSGSATSSKASSTLAAPTAKKHKTQAVVNTARSKMRPMESAKRPQFNDRLVTGSGSKR